MTALAESLQNILGTKLPMVALPDVPPKIDAAYQIIKKKLGEGQPVEPLTAQESEYWIDLARATVSTGSWNDLKSREIKNISLCLWHGENALATDENFLLSFLKACESRIKKSLCRALIWVYLYNYERNKPGVALLGEWLTGVVGQWDWLWSDRNKDLFLFDGHEAARSIGNAIMTSKGDVSDVLESLGLTGALQSGGMSSAALSETLKNYRENARLYDAGETVSRLKRILDWADLKEKEFAYPKLKTLFIESLLLPWVGGNPEEKIINTTQSFLLDIFGDPRLGGASWNGVDENAMRVIRGWLVKRALAQFLDVVDELALDHQWKYRRAFWMAYYNKGVISDAWVAFASNGATKAQQIARRHEDNSWLSFGNLYGSGDPNHAVLILRIGNLTIADFSHNGKCRLWDSRNERAPKPYAKHYDRSDLVNSKAESEYIHSNSPNYLWQGRVASEINNITGVKTIQRDYMPR